MSDESTPTVDETPVPAPAAAEATTDKPAKKAPAKKAAAKKAPAKKAAPKATQVAVEGDAPSDNANVESSSTAKKAAQPRKKAAAKPKKTAESNGAEPAEGEAPAKAPAKKAAKAPAQSVLFQAPEQVVQPRRKKPVAEAPADDTAGNSVDGSADEAAVKSEAPAQNNRPAKKTPPKPPADPKPADASVDGGGEAEASEDADGTTDGEGGDGAEGGEGAAKRRPRRRGGRRRRKPASAGDGDESSDDEDDAEDAGNEGDESEAESEDSDTDEAGTGASKRTRTRNRAPKNPEDEIASVNGSTRLEAKKQRRREGREAGRRRAPIVSEAEFLARREAVDRVMVIRQREQLTQIGVLEDNVLVEHYVSRESQASMIGNVYLGRVQNVLPSMEAAFIDIGKGRNAVLYAGEVNWSGLGHKDGQPRKIESVLTSGQTVLVQVTKDPVGQKGARLTGQISIPGRFLVYVPDGTTSGISRKLPDTERNRLKTLLKEIVPGTAGVIVRTAAEGASEEELTRDVERLTARWADIEAKVEAGKSPELLYGEPDLTLKVVRDLFTEDFTKLIVQGDDAWELVQQYVEHVAPDLADRLERFEPDAEGPPAAQDLFAAFRVDEQIAKGLDRKVWLPSGGSLIIDRTEAMTVVDVNTGKFTGSGGNLEETVTKNNLEAAEEIVRQLRLRDIGGIIVVDFIDMVLESNRDLVLRRLVECLGRDRTRHQVAEVTSLGLVQMTRKRIGTGLVEAFSEECPHCKGRGIIVHHEPIATAGAASVSDDEPRGNRRRGNRRGRGEGGQQGQGNDARPTPSASPSPADLAGSRPHPESAENADDPADTAETAEAPEAAVVAVAEDSATESAVSEVADTQVADTQVVEAVVATVDVTDAPEPAAPAVVTSTRRRRTATRPAGPPSAATVDAEAEPVSEPSTEPVSEPVSEAVPPVDEPVDEPVAEPAAEPAAEPEAEDVSEPQAEPEADPAPVEEHEVSVLHVPIKKRGVRKR